MNDVRSKHHLSYWPRVGRNARTAFKRAGPWFMGVILARSIATGVRDFFSPGVVAVTAVAFGGACVTYGLIRSLAPSGRWNALAWIASGTVGIDALWALLAVTVPLDAFGADVLLLRDPLFWAFWSVVGAIAGYSYWRVAEGMG